MHILRRLQESSDDSGESLHLLFLDWEKAFDSVPHHKIIETLALFGIPYSFLNIIASLYNQAEFQVQVGPQTSSWAKQKCGIRQGCPLSPYLFVLILDVMFTETRSALPSSFKNKHPRGFPFTDILYADDTLLISKSARHLSTFLHTLEKVAKQYGLTLNRSKTVHIPMNAFDNITFETGEVVSKELETTYLGAKFGVFPDPGLELSNRLQQTLIIWRRLFLFWKYSEVPIRLKIIIYHAIIKTKLLYGLETLVLLPAHKRQPDAFYLRGLRQIMGMKTTFIDRTNTNERVYINAACVLAQKETQTPLLPLSRQWEIRRQKLMAFLNTPQAAQPEIKATFFFPPSFEFQEVRAQDSWRPNSTIWGRRRGRPRGFWVREVIQEIWKKMRRIDPDLPQIDLDSAFHRREIAWHLASSTQPFAL